MSRELWAVENCEACDGFGFMSGSGLLRVRTMTCGFCTGAGIRKFKLDFDTIWFRYRKAKRWPMSGLTKDELRKVIGLEPEEDE